MPTTDEMIDFLVAARFPDFRGVLRLPRVVRGAGTPEIPEDERQGRLAEIRAYITDLRGKLPGEVAEQYKTERQLQRDEQRQRLAAARERDEQARFYNRPDAVADYAHWAKAAYWTLDEGVALLLGKSPEVVSWESVGEHIDRSTFAKRYGRILNLARRSEQSGHLGVRNEPRRFVKWAKLNGIDCSAELEEAVAICGGSSLSNPSGSMIRHSPHHSADEENTLSGKGRQTALKLIIGMAIGGYGYDPKKSRSGVVSEIVEDLLKQGIHLTDETVRHWLREGVKLLAVEQERTKDR